MLPMPAVAKCSSSGRVFSNATNSAKVAAGTSAWVTSTLGVRDNCEIETKSLIGS
ncbi:hypothetical protein D9M68_442300 [compost metagenome]